MIREGLLPSLHLLLATLFVGRDGLLSRTLECRFLHLVGVLPFHLVLLLAQFPAHLKLLAFWEFLKKLRGVVVCEFSQEYGEVESTKNVGDVEGLTASVKEMYSALGGVTFLIVL